MITRIVCYLLFPMLVLSLFLSMAGVQQVSFGDSYYNFMRSVTGSFNSWKLNIPKIPNVPYVVSNDFDKAGGVLDVIIKIGNFFVFILNSLIALINLIITILNIVVQIIQFVLTIIYQCKDFITGLSNSIIAYV